MEQERKQKVIIEDEDGNTVVIEEQGFNVFDHEGKKKQKEDKKFTAIMALVECCVSTLMLILYILLGVFVGMWANGWVFFFIPEFIFSIVRAIRKKNPNMVNVTFLAIFTFFFVCMVCPGLKANLWHPMWTVFLIIPVYHSICGTINKVKRTLKE